MSLLHPRKLCDRFCGNWPSGSGEEDFYISSMYFRYFVIISRWKRKWPYIWIRIPYWPSGSEEDFLKFQQCILTILLLSSVRKGHSSSFVQQEYPSHKDALCQVVLEKTMKMWKVYRRTNGRSDGWPEKLTCAFSSGELKGAKKRLNIPSCSCVP